jgi:hypothetical protein
VTWTEYEPIAVVLDTEIASEDVSVAPGGRVILAGLREGVMPLEEADAVRLTIPTKEFTLFTATIELP